ncbi:hypothetical protein [Polyangium sp. 6x1]|uniref:hypothetical protein n=1 Tax=Polyangium sp. 6x1 TaxID=3042689 RepID=UPI002482F296|nr:hypothetical protein [Polyangium sp. 6x1]
MVTAPLHNSPFAALVRHFALSLAGGQALYVAPGIPEKKFSGALNSYAEGVRRETVLALCDATRLGSASEGFLITTSALYLHPRNDSPRSVRFIDITEASQVPLTTAKGGYTGQWGLRIQTRDKAIDIVPEEMPLDALQAFLAAVHGAVQQGIVDSTDRFIIVEDLPDVVKLDYVMSIVLLALQNDGKIDPVEMQEIQLLMSRLRFSPALRANVRAFMSAPTTPIEQVLDRLSAGVPRGTEHAIHLSLLKDVIQVFRRTRPGSDLYADPFVRFLSQRFQVTRDQATIIVDACKLDEDLLAGKVADEVIMARAKDLAARGAAVGVPLAAVYLSGSVVGLSAAGITSGLAALGLGGILGLSAMVTGIGVVVLLGVGVYKSVQYLTNRGEDARKARREALVQEVLRMHQTAINDLIEDVNEISSELVDLQRQAEIDRVRLGKLAAELSLFARAMKGLRDKGELGAT